MKAWPIDPLDLRDLKLEVSEKLLYQSLCVTYSVDYDHASRARRLLTIRLASWSIIGDQAIRLCPPNCGDALKPSNTKAVEPIGGWPSRELGYGNSVEGCTWVIRSQASASKGLPSRRSERKVHRLYGGGWEPGSHLRYSQALQKLQSQAKA